MQILILNVMMRERIQCVLFEFYRQRYIQFFIIVVVLFLDGDKQEVDRVELEDIGVNLVFGFI